MSCDVLHSGILLCILTGMCYVSTRPTKEQVPPVVKCSVWTALQLDLTQCPFLKAMRKRKGKTQLSYSLSAPKLYFPNHLCLLIPPCFSLVNSNDEKDQDSL